ncbi:unnamed protein product [Didymodactylos carnosus]|uniref:EF-hand domain-containing family member C2 n=1 Tax=Didymodactylos carnosus TaxID=1234261 RepID=A0A814N6A9_9BILA|nr:unnamed protein product [Didymodactylos carnosus]CAF1088963.1 unnamed protein product [Didymodactylos carnosus]CAF3756448.1 unnamed protein product [Didymodactylos carnosus]CAF3854497.1 unnamed protein product [Didymodactylos carnosus]
MSTGTQLGIGGVPLPGEDLRPKNSVYARGEGPDRPAWLAFDKQVLCFDAYFQESITERPQEQYRIRKCHIYFYPEDDTVQVVEQRQANVGFPQGTILKRHRVPLVAPNDDRFYTIEYFNVGSELSLYGRVYKIIDCDQFTRNFLTKLGVRVPPGFCPPEDPFLKHRQVLDGGQNPLRPYEKVDTLKKFLNHDQHVLRFWAVWDNTDSLYGDIREFVLHYFLSDDTMEIREVLPPNSGRDAPPIFLSRGKLPKEFQGLRLPGENAQRTVLNVFGQLNKQRYILDNLKTGALNETYYTDQDLAIGKMLNVYGRKVLMTDCDEFTKNHYRTKYGVQDFSPIAYRKVADTKPMKQSYPYTGFGSEEDSLSSTRKIIPEPPKKDYNKFMGFDRQGYETNILRFMARIITKDGIQAARRFIISYFLSDDTIYIYEPPVRNSGIQGGKFLERQKVKKPNQSRYPVEISDYFGAEDFYVGARLEINGFLFDLFDADEYAFKLMEEHNHMFSKANRSIIMQKLKQFFSSNSQAVSQFEANDPHHHGCFGDFLTDHEIITIARYYALQVIQEYDIYSVVSVVQEQLRKNNYETFSPLKENLITRDPTMKGRLPVEEVRIALKSVRVPLPDYLLNIFLKLLTQDDGFIDYSDLLKALNWRDAPVQAPKPPAEEASLADDPKQFEKTTHERKKFNVEYREFLKDLGLNTTATT